jgi:TRAP-type uncharacterized transport system fused permease subunit
MIMLLHTARVFIYVQAPCELKQSVLRCTYTSIRLHVHSAACNPQSFTLIYQSTMSARQADTTALYSLLLALLQGLLHHRYSFLYCAVCSISSAGVHAVQSISQMLICVLSLQHSVFVNLNDDLVLDHLRDCKIGIIFACSTSMTIERLRDCIM